MIVLKTHFKCALCGKFRKLGVTESDAIDPTAVCHVCIRKGTVELLTDAAPAAEDTVPDATAPGVEPSEA